MASPATDPDLIAQAVINVLTQTGRPVGTIGSIVKRTPDGELTAAQIPILEIKPVQNVHTRVAAANTKMDMGWLELTYRDAPLEQQQAANPSLTLSQIEDRNWANRNAIIAALDADDKLAAGGPPAVSDCASQVEETWRPDGPFAEWKNAEWVVWHARINYKGPKGNLPPALAPLWNGLLSYYSFDAGTGSTVADAAAGRTGTWGGTLGSQWGTGIIHDGGIFNGSDNLVDLGVQPAFHVGVSDSFSVSAWVKPSSVASSATIALTGTHGVCYNWRLGRSGSALIFDNGVDSPTTVASSGTLVVGTWTYVVLVYDAGVVRAYVNGVAGSPFLAQVTASCTTESTKIGSSTPNSAIFDFFAGTIDEVGLWGRALTASDVSQLYNGGAGLQYPRA